MVRGCVTDVARALLVERYGINVPPFPDDLTRTGHRNESPAFTERNRRVVASLVFGSAAARPVSGSAASRTRAPAAAKPSQLLGAVRTCDLDEHVSERW